MRRIIEYEAGKPVYKNVYWSDHRHDCRKCERVDVEKSTTFTLACAEGSPLLSEFLIDKQRPVEKQKAAEVLAWAKEAGVFKIPK